MTEMRIGEKIRRLRIQKGMSQARLGEALSVSQDTISLWETGKSLPDIETLVRICAIFDVTSDYLLGLSQI